MSSQVNQIKHTSRCFDSSDDKMWPRPMTTRTTHVSIHAKFVFWKWIDNNNSTGESVRFYHCMAVRRPFCRRTDLSLSPCFRVYDFYNSKNRLAVDMCVWLVCVPLDLCSYFVHTILSQVYSYTRRVSHSSHSWATASKSERATDRESKLNADNLVNMANQTFVCRAHSTHFPFTYGFMVIM